MSEQSGAIVRMPVRVRYHECDPQGIVFNAHYLAYADMACFECIKTLYGSHTALRDRGIDLVLAESTVRYLVPCQFDDQLDVEVFADRVGTTSLVLRFAIRNGAELATEVVNRYVWIDPETLRPIAPPGEVRAALAPFAPTN